MGKEAVFGGRDCVKVEEVLVVDPLRAAGEIGSIGRPVGLKPTLRMGDEMDEEEDEAMA